MTRSQLTLLILFGPMALLLIPLIGMQVSDEVNWSSSDFMIAGVLLLALGGTLTLVVRFVKKRMARIILLFVVLFLFLLFWAELAVGVFGSPWAGS